MYVKTKNEGRIDALDCKTSYNKKMRKICIYAAGGTGRRIADKLLSNNESICCFFDSDLTKIGDNYKGIPIESTKDIINTEFDEIIVGAMSGYDEIMNHLVSMGINPQKINDTFVSGAINARRDFLYRLAEIQKSMDKGFSVAEAGVFRGEFAKEINKAYPKSKLYLFDTFEGFDSRDFSYELNESNTFAGHFNNTSVEFVISRMKYKENCIVRKGYFPDTAQGIDDIFQFVSLDMDLFKPVYEGIRFFYPKLIRGGVILVDDYFSPAYPNVKRAVDQFEKETSSIIKMPIGDNNGLAIIKL